MVGSKDSAESENGPLFSVLAVLYTIEHMFERYEAEMADFLGSPPEIEPADLVGELDAVLARITREEARVAELLARVIETGGLPP